MTTRATYLQVKDVLDRIRAFHRQLRNLFKELGAEIEEERFQLLLKYMEQREQHLKMQLARFKKAEAEGVLNTWLQFIPEEPLRRVFDEREFSEEAGIGHVVEIALEFDEALIELYRHLAESASAPRVQELFAQLLQIEERETEKLAWSLQEFDREDS